MRLAFDTTFIDHILNRWSGREEDYGQALRHPVYRWLLRHQSQFLQSALDSAEYLVTLLHIDGIDMERRAEEIRRNLRYILSLDLEKIASTVQKYLPEDVRRDDAVIPIHFIIGVAGLAAQGHIILDPSPCPWFINDGSDRDLYLNGHIIPTIRHELHHVGYMRIRPVRDANTLENQRMLALDLLQEAQMEGGAKICEKDHSDWDLPENDKPVLFEAVAHMQAAVTGWLSAKEAPILEKEWTEFYSFWEQGTLYRVGEYLNKALVAQRVYASVADCMVAEPLKWFRRACRALRAKTNETPNVRSDCMSKGKWIWYPGEFEIYHSLLLHSRRYERQVHVPCVWGLSSVYPIVSFSKTFDLERETTFTAYATAPGAVTVMTGEFPRGSRVTVGTGTLIKAGPGRCTIRVETQKPFGLPAAFIDGEDVFTDESWTANPGLRSMRGELELPHAACTPAYTRAEDNPEIFPFCYERWDVVEARAENGGVLYDFGRETFGRLHIENADPAATLNVRFGESETEAFDESPVIYEYVSGKAEYEFPSYAFRYIFIPGATDKLKVWMEYEYLPLEDKADFSCDVPEVKKVFDVAVHTFHLNSREFFLDGIKRDRWVWSGDAYQSYMVNNYLFFDQEINKRTIRALLGKPPYEQHINSINDYSLYLIIAVWDYYYATADIEFVRSIFDRLSMLYDFIHGRLDEDGLVCARPGDWVFIDWARFDREGPQCAEQILLWKAMDAMDKLSALLGRQSPVAPGEADALRKKVEERYWDEEKGGYMDSFVSGKRNITRHANIFAVLYDFAPQHVERIVRDVLMSESVDAITTPYFKFFELMALCHVGKVEAAQEMILSYWYPMLELGATSIWEQFDPREKGAEHYAMYGDPYGRSLCHAWGSGPVYLLGRYVAGVSATSTAYETFDVAPQPGAYKTFTATVPVFGGTVSVEYDAAKKRVCATASRAGGTLRFAGKSVDMKAGERAEICW